MKTRTNHVLRKRAAGETAMGINVQTASAENVEMAGAAAYDFVDIDCEHGTTYIDHLTEMLHPLAIVQSVAELESLPWPNVDAPEVYSHLPGAIREIQEQGRVASAHMAISHRLQHSKRSGIGSFVRGGIQPRAAGAQREKQWLNGLGKPPAECGSA